MDVFNNIVGKNFKSGNGEI